MCQGNNELFLWNFLFVNFFLSLCSFSDAYAFTAFKVSKVVPFKAVLTFKDKKKVYEAFQVGRDSEWPKIDFTMIVPQISSFSSYQGIRSFFCSCGCKIDRVKISAASDFSCFYISFTLQKYTHQSITSSPIKKIMEGKRFYANKHVIVGLDQCVYSEGIKKMELLWTKCINLRWDYIYANPIPLCNVRQRTFACRRMKFVIFPLFPICWKSCLIDNML